MRVLAPTPAQATAGAKPASDSNGQRWLLLIHQIPPKPDYLRVKIGRRLQRVGAVAVKNSVYVLPDSEQAFEDFQWLRAEIVSGGGDATVCRAEFLDGLTSEELRHLFRTARAADYAEIAASARERWADARRGRATRPADDLARLRKRFHAVAAIDFFGAPGHPVAKAALEALEMEVRPDDRAEGTPALAANRDAYVGRTWVTRSNVFVDRIASAWLVRRFVDSDARFKFVHATRYRLGPGEVRFDMFEGEFTHEGDRCTFEVLLDRFGLDDPALRSLGEIVHDIDLKDGKFDREDAPGVARVLAAIVRTQPNDEARLERGGALFDQLYALLRAEAAETQSAAQDMDARAI